MGLAYTKGAVAEAKRDGLHLIQLDIVGKYAKRGTIQFSGPVGPETAQKIKDFFTALLANPTERMK